MLINIGGLWESPIAIADERPISPPDYSEINNYESERTTFRSYNKELCTIAGGHDVTDFIYFKNASPEECNQDETHLQGDVVNSSGTFHEKIIKACYGYMDVNQIPPNKESDIALGKHEQIGLSPNSQRENRGIKFRHDINAGSAKHISGHASKSLLVRSSKAKDRYSKINTAKGLRDRRVRLSVSTAIQFYSLQHKLGFDQPSKALDWLMSKAKSAIDELPRPSSISKLNSLSSNSATSLTDIVPTSGGPERVSHSVPRSLTCPVENTENKMGSTAACIEERKWEDLKVGAKNVVLPMPQDCTEASSHVEICSERKRCQPSVPQKKGNKEKEITLTSPFGKQSSGCEIGFSCDPNNIIACLEPFSSLCIPSGQDGTDGQEMHGPPFVVYSNYFELWPDAGETGNLSEKCMSPLVFSLQESDSAYVEAALRHSGMLNGNQNRGVPQTSSSTTDSTDGANGSRNGFDRLNLQHGIKAFYFEQDQ